MGLLLGAPSKSMRVRATKFFCPTMSARPGAAETSSTTTAAMKTFIIFNKLDVLLWIFRSDKLPFAYCFRNYEFKTLQDCELDEVVGVG
jgi:hypothetical protein